MGSVSKDHSQERFELLQVLAENRDTNEPSLYLWVICVLRPGTHVRIQSVQRRYKMSRVVLLHSVCLPSQPLYTSVVYTLYLTLFFEDFRASNYEVWCSMPRATSLTDAHCRREERISDSLIGSLLNHVPTGGCSVSVFGK